MKMVLSGKLSVAAVAVCGMGCVFAEGTPRTPMAPTAGERQAEFLSEMQRQGRRVDAELAAGACNEYFYAESIKKFDLLFDKNMDGKIQACWGLAAKRIADPIFQPMFFDSWKEVHLSQKPLLDVQGNPTTDESARLQELTFSKVQGHLKRFGLIELNGWRELFEKCRSLNVSENDIRSVPGIGVDAAEVLKQWKRGMKRVPGGEGAGSGSQPKALQVTSAGDEGAGSNSQTRASPVTPAGGEGEGCCSLTATFSYFFCGMLVVAVVVGLVFCIRKKKAYAEDQFSECESEADSTF